MANILIIEDNHMNLEMACELLERPGHSIIKAETAIEGIKLAKTKSPDLVLMDLSLPEMDGLTATKILKQDPLTRNIPIVAFTAFVMKSDKEKALGAGCEGFISKPIDVMTFAKTVEGFIKIAEPVLANTAAIVPEPTAIPYAVPAHKSYTHSHNKWHKILIIDDNPMNAELLKEILEQIGQSSVIAYNGKQALEIIQKEKFDMILLDIMMPEMSGFEIIEHLKANPRTSDVPVTFISALNETEDIVKGLDLGSHGYITKPYNIDEVKARILNTLRVKDLQDQIKSEKNKLDLIFKFSADGIVMLNSQFEIVSCNDTFSKWFGLKKESVIGENFYSVLKVCPTSKHAEDGDETSFIKEVVIKNPTEEKYFQISYSKINPTDNEAEGYVLVIRDITAFKEIESQKETFVATLTHDLKTPTGAQIMALELLLKGTFGKLTDEQEEIIKDTLNSNRYMFNMVSTILSTYKFENGNISLKREEINISELVKNCYSELKYIIEDKKQEVVFEFEHDNILAYADSMEIKRVIINLLSNAIYYSLEGGRITIRASENEDEIKVVFIDNGRGLNKEDVSNLFNKYTSYAKKFRQIGTGLGLYLSKQIIEAHRGRIFAESEEGKGSTFGFYLPKKS